MVCLRPGCGQPVKARDRKFCGPACATLARMQPARRCEVCNKPLTPVQSASRQRACSRTCGAQLCAASNEVHDDAFRNRVKRLWCEEGKTDTEIGKILGVTKNVVVGVRRRMGLPKRETGRWPKDYVPQIKRPTMPARKRPPPQRKRAKIPNQGGNNAARNIAAAAVRQASPIHVQGIPGNGCQYPVGENPWRICDQPRVPPPDKEHLSAYCCEHYQLCFNAVPQRRGSEDFLARLAA